MSFKLGYLTYALERNPTGIGIYTQGLLEGLRNVGFELIPLVAGELPGYKNYVRLRGARLLPELLTIGQVEIARVARKLGLALIHDASGAAPLLLAPAKRVTTIHDVFPLSIPGHSTVLETLIYKYWLPVVLKIVDGVITDSGQSKHDIQRFLKVPEERIEVVNLASRRHFTLLDEKQIRSTLSRVGVECPYILYVGSIEPRKNLLRLLEAYASLRAWSSNWKLVIVGARNYWKSSPVAEAVVKMGLPDCVKFTGYVPDEDLPALYNAADLFVFPSLYEGFGLPVLEAMACGAPVIASNTSSLPEVAGDAALLVDPYNVDEIASAMRRILSDPDLAHDLRCRGLERAAQFSWEKTARETIKVYEQVLGI